MSSPYLCRNFRTIERCRRVVATAFGSCFSLVPIPFSAAACRKPAGVMSSSRSRAYVNVVDCSRISDTLQRRERQRHLQETQYCRRPSTCRSRQLRANAFSGLSLPDVRADALLRAPRQGARRGGDEISNARVPEELPGHAQDQSCRLPDDQGVEVRRHQMGPRALRLLRAEGRKPGLQADGPRPRIRRGRACDRDVSRSDDLRQAGDAAAGSRDGPLPARPHAALDREAALWPGRPRREAHRHPSYTQTTGIWCAASSSTSMAST